MSRRRDLPIDAGAGGRLIPRESNRCIRCHNRRRWLLNHAFDNAEAASAALLEAAALEDDAPEAAHAPADTPNAIPLLDELSALGDPACAGGAHRRRARCASGSKSPNCGTVPSGRGKSDGRGGSGTAAETGERSWKRKCTACV